MSVCLTAEQLGDALAEHMTPDSRYTPPLVIDGEQGEEKYRLSTPWEFAERLLEDVIEANA